MVEVNNLQGSARVSGAVSLIEGRRKTAFALASSIFGIAVDTVKGPGGFEDGSVYRPHDTLAEAITATPAGGRISVVTGSYSAAGMTITKPMTISAPVGAASFGN